MPLTIYRRGSVWHYRGTVAGRRLRGSCGTEDKTLALQIAADKEAREWKSGLYGPASVLTFAQAAMLYRAAHRSDRFLAKVEDHWKDTPVREITPGAIRQSCHALQPGCGPATMNRQVIVPTQAVINHAAEAELCPRISVTRFKVPKKEREPATWEWIEAFMEHASPHIAALACFMFLTGARITESLNVRWPDVDLTKASAVIRQTKTATERVAHLPSVLVAAIANIEGERVGRVFRYSHRDTAAPSWHAAIRRAGIRRLTFHACRHGFATAALQAGLDPVTVARLGGWKTPALVLSTYGHAMRDVTVTDRLVGSPETQKGRKSLAGLG